MIRFHEALAPLMVPVQTLHPAPDNPNNGDIDEIIASIMVNGCYRPVYAMPDGTIVGGHHLYAALVELGASEIPVLPMDTDERGRRRIMLGDNRIAALAKTDNALLLELLESMEDDLPGTGYTNDDIAALRAMAAREARTPLDAGEDGIVCPKCGYRLT